jgi:hypothetical protein
MGDPFVCATRHASALASKKLSDLADAYQEQLERWFLAPAKHLADRRERHDGVAMLAKPFARSLRLGPVAPGRTLDEDTCRS